MDLIFRSMSHAAGVEIPPGKRLPWEKPRKGIVEESAIRSRIVETRQKSLQILIGRLLGFLGKRLIRASDALVSQRSSAQSASNSPF